MTCQHSGCQCAEAAIERNGRHYCSESCAEAQATEGAASGRSCECGHASCSGMS